MIILAVGAHPDDIEISCAGTLAKMKKAGHEVVLCHASMGDKGHFVIPPDELCKTRKKEAREAGAVINSEVICLGLRDGEILSGNEETRLKFIDLIRRVHPDMVITHAPNDYMLDHVEVSKLVFDTTFLATLPGFISEFPIAKKVPSLYYMNNLSGIDFQPTLYVDISETIDTKIRMLEKHQSQITWLKDHDNVDIIDLVNTFAKMMGIQGGCAYAEGFIQHMAWTRPNAVRFPV